MADEKMTTNNQAPSAKLPPMTEESAPMTPPMPPMGMEGGEQAGMSEEEMRADLQSDMEDLNTKRGAMNAQFYISKNKLEEAKAKMVQAIFDILKTAGVDPTDLASIQSFIQQLEVEDPDLLKLFNVAFDTLATAPEAAPDLAGAPPQPMGPEAMVPGGRPPVGTSGLEPDMPLPTPPEGMVGQPQEAPGIGGKFKNVAGMMPQV